MLPNTLIIFDFDGTIVDSIPFAYALYQQMAKEHKLTQLNQAEFAALKSKSTKDILKQLRISWWKMPGLVRHGRELLGENLDEMMPIAGISEVMQQFASNNVQLAVLTSNSRKNVERFFDRYELPELRFIDSVSRLKNKANLLVRRRREFMDYHVFYVGDEIRDVEAARKAQVSSIAVEWGFNTALSLKAVQPDYLVSTPQALKNVIQAHMSMRPPSRGGL